MSRSEPHRQPAAASPNACSLRQAFAPLAWLAVISALGSAFITGAPGARGQTATEAVPQVARDGWKDCFYNDRLIRCRDEQTADGLRIVWSDGIRSSFQRRSAPSTDAASLWADRYGGLWRRDLLPQGNTLLIHLGNGNRILVPLRFPCRPPLKGEVGYCHR